MRSFLTGILFSAIGVSAAYAGPLNITVGNAGFETLTTGTAPDGLCYPGGPNGCAVLASWVNTDGYAFVSSGADLGNNAFGDVKLSYATASPNGGNFVALDGNNIDGVGTIAQMLSGLTVGDTYAVTFYQAAAEQLGYYGAISEQWQVSLGGQTKNAAIMNYSGSNWVGWEQETVVFNATSTSELLSFLSLGLPGNGSPPFALLDGISVQDVPEPAAFGVLGMGALGLMLLARRRGQSKAV
jgi:hypothetical protein